METSRELKRLAKVANNLTHEFTAPMSVLVATVEELKRSEEDPQKKLQLDVALRNAYKFRSLMNDVFSISRVLGGHILFNLTHADIAGFINGICDIFSKAAKDKEIELQFSCNHESLVCYFDYQKLYKVIYKLIANGIRFSKPKSGLVKVNVHYSEAKDEIQIEVWDNGIGIVPEKVPYVFDLNYEEDPIHLAHYQGTSVGLFLTKLYTESMHGSISVESTKFKFTRFKLTLPYFVNPNKLPFEHIEFVDTDNIEQLLSSEEVLQVDTDEILQIKHRENGSPIVVIAACEKNEDYWRDVFKENAKIVLSKTVDLALGQVFDLVPDLIILEANDAVGNPHETIDLIKKNAVVNHIPTVIHMPNGSEDEATMVKSSVKADDVIIDANSPENTRMRLNNLLANTKLVYEAAWNKAMNELKKTKSLSLEDSFLNKLNTVIDQYISDEAFNVDKLSDQMFMSRTQIHRKLKTITNQSTTQYIKRYKLKKALKDLEKHTGTISEIAYKYGFSSPAYFSRVFSEVYKKKPSDVVRNNM